MPRRSDYPTVPPPFNLATFARDSDAKVTIGKPVFHDDDAAPLSQMRPVTRPGISAPTDEDWACTQKGRLVLTLPLAELKRRDLDHRAGYLLSWMDGSIDIETLAEVAAMIPRNEVLRIVRNLVGSGVVTFR